MLNLCKEKGKGTPFMRFSCLFLYKTILQFNVKYFTNKADIQNPRIASSSEPVLSMERMVR